MAIDYVARGLAAHGDSKHEPFLEDFGGGSNGSLDANRLGFRDAFQNGVTRLALAGGVYLIDTIPGTEDVINNWATGAQPSVILPEGFNLLDGRGSLLGFGNSSRGIVSQPYSTWAHPGHFSYLATDIATGDRELTLEAGEGANWQPGDTLLWQLGSLPYDRPETINWGFAQVKAVNGDVLTIDQPMPEPFALADVAGLPYTDYFGEENRYNKTLYKMPITQGLEIRDLRCVAASNANVAHFVRIMGAKDVVLRRLAAQGTGNAFVLQYVENAAIEDCSAENARVISSPFGRGIGLAEARNITIRNFRASGCKTAYFLEAGSEAQVYGTLVENTGDPLTGVTYGNDFKAFMAIGRSRLNVRDATIKGFGGYILGETYTADPAYSGTIRFEGHLTLIHPTQPLGMRLEQMHCLLDYRIAGNRELWDFRNPAVWRRRIYLRNGMLEDFRGLPGALQRLRIQASPSLTFGTGGQLENFFVGRPSDVGLDYSGSLIAGHTTTIDFVGGFNGGTCWEHRKEQLQIRVRTASGTNLNATDAYIDIECFLAPDRLDQDITWSDADDARISGPGAGEREAVFINYDPPGIAAGATAQVDFAIPNMAAGDFVEAVSFNYPLNGLSIRSAEAIAGAARIILENHTAATIDKGVNNVRILWRKGLSTG
ncbi:MAG: hypothetical protein KDE55_02105 [Novosphingobium sp.]|nr:hypothetical protein [Novosphingobium sp.]